MTRPRSDALIELDGATNDRLLGEEGLLPGIGVHELVFGVGYAHIVNAAFTHAAPDGGRFNSNQRGAWYAGIERETSIAEVGYHKLRQLEEIDWPHEEISTCDDYLADFATGLHDIRGRRPEYKRFLKPEPLPECYREPQQLASDLLAHQSNGIIYPSVRRKAGPVSSASVPRWSTTSAESGLSFGRGWREVCAGAVREVEISWRKLGCSLYPILACRSLGHLRMENHSVRLDKPVPQRIRCANILGWSHVSCCLPLDLIADCAAI